MKVGDKIRLKHPSTWVDTRGTGIYSFRERWHPGYFTVVKRLEVDQKVKVIGWLSTKNEWLVQDEWCECKQEILNEFYDEPKTEKSGYS